jgi:hypothetical protein
MKQPSKDEVLKIEEMRVESELLHAKLQLALLELKKSCGAPSWAGINAAGQWSNPQGKPIANGAPDRDR